MNFEERLLQGPILLVGVLLLTTLVRTTASNVVNISSNTSQICQVHEELKGLSSKDGCKSNLGKCLCHNSCADYGECFSNVRLRKGFKNIYIKTKCLKDWTDKTVEELCLKARPFSDFLSSNSDPFLDIPVSSNKTTATYGNYYCAICNNESPLEIEVWQGEVDCNLESFEINNFGINVKNIQDNLLFLNDTWGLYINTSSEATFQPCKLYPSPSTSIFNELHQCNDYVSKCSASWTDSSYQTKCSSYTNLVTDIKSRKKFQNVHCAICNFANFSDLDCDKPIMTRSFAPESGFAFSLLIDFGVKNNQCPIGSRWDELSRPKQCRKVVCYNKSSKYQYGSCTKLDGWKNNNLNDSEQHHLWNLTSCDKKDFFNLSEITFGPNQTVTTNATGKTFGRHEYELHDEGILVCITTNYSAAMGWISLLGLSLSSVCILIHLSAFALVPKLRNISGKNMASLCTALLIAYICFIIAAFKNNIVDGCPVLASFMYYFFLASFTWMNVIAFDIWLTVRKATSKLIVTSGKQRKKFILYSIYAWLLPGVALTAVLAIDHSSSDLVPSSYLPELGERFCWFGQKNAILVYFAIPLGVIMLINLTFFLITILNIRETTRSTNANSVSNPHKKQLKLCMKLAVVMGLSWISGIIAGLLQNEFMWYLFVILNAFQGLYILLAYTCTSNVRKDLGIRRINLFKYASRDVDTVDSSTLSQINIVNSDSNQANTATTNTSSSPSTPNLNLKQ